MTYLIMQAERRGAHVLTLSARMRFSRGTHPCQTCLISSIVQGHDAGGPSSILLLGSH
jgi:hypothetical protein